MHKLLKTLCGLPEPSGDEGLIQNLLAERWEPHVKALEFNGVGNLMALD